MIKKLFCLSLTLILAFCVYGCSNSTDETTTLPESSQSESSVDLAVIMDDISANAQMPAECIDIITNADLLDYYGIEASLVKSFAVRMNASGYQDEIVMIEAVDNASADAVAAILEERLADSAESMRTYLPEQYEIIQNCSVETNGEYVSMFVSADAQTMIEIFNSYFA